MQVKTEDSWWRSAVESITKNLVQPSILKEDYGLKNKMNWWPFRYADSCIDIKCWSDGDSCVGASENWRAARDRAGRAAHHDDAGHCQTLPGIGCATAAGKGYRSHDVSGR